MSQFPNSLDNNMKYLGKYISQSPGLTKSGVQGAPSNNRWVDLETCQMDANRQNVNCERQEGINRRKKYKEELDKLIQLKEQNKENLRKANAQNNVLNSIKQCEQIEKDECAMLRKLQKQSLDKSVHDKIARQQEISKINESEKEWFKKQQQESLMLHQHALEQKRAQRLQIVEDCKNNYKEYLCRKQEEAKMQEKQDIEYFHKECEMRKKLEKDSKDFLERIRAEKTRYKEVVGCFKNLEQEQRNKLSNIDEKFVKKGFMEKEARFLEKESQELERQRNCRNEISSTLNQQIEHNKLKKERLRLENLRIENELLTKELTLQQTRENKYKEQRRNIVKEMMHSLEEQLKSREKGLFGSNHLTQTEEEYNYHEKTHEGVINVPEKTVDAIPGFCVQKDRLKMNAIIERNSKMTNSNISRVMNDSSADHRTNKNTSRPQYISSSNILKGPSQFVNEYEYLKYKKSHANFNIISNQPFI